MKKCIIVLFYLILFNSLFVLGQNNKTTIINPEYKKEVVNWCPSYEETEINPELIKRYDCGAASKNYYTKQQFNMALDFAKKIKYIYRTKDINALANIAPYHEFYIYNYKNKKFIEIKSKEQLLKLDKSILLNESMLQDINESNLFWNWKGFMIGKGGVWFFVKDDIVMLSIHL